MSIKQKNTSFFDKKIMLQAAKDSLKKLNPALLIKNPVIFIVAIGAALTTLIVFGGLFSGDFSFFNFLFLIFR